MMHFINTCRAQVDALKDTHVCTPTYCGHVHLLCRLYIYECMHVSTTFIHTYIYVTTIFLGWVNLFCAREHFCVLQTICIHPLMFVKTFFFLQEAPCPLSKEPCSLSEEPHIPLMFVNRSCLSKQKTCAQHTLASALQTSTGGLPITRLLKIIGLFCGILSLL